MPEKTVSIEGVQKLLQKLNPQKACGPDQIPARILRDLADVIAPYPLFSSTFSTVYFFS
jgi:hypothetical protein